MTCWLRYLTLYGITSGELGVYSLFLEPLIWWFSSSVANASRILCLAVIYQVEGRSWIYVQHVNLAFFGGRPVNLRATRKFTGQ